MNLKMGEKIKARRNELKITRERLGELIGVSARFLADVEVGKVGISLQTFKNICSVLFISADYLLGLNENDSPKDFSIVNKKIEELNPIYYPALISLLDELISINN